MTTYFHGTDNPNWTPHVGAFISDTESAAAQFADAANRKNAYIYRVELDPAGFDIVEFDADAISEDAQSWDDVTGAKAAAAEGRDGWTCTDGIIGVPGTTHTEIGIVTEALASAVKIVGRITTHEFWMENDPDYAAKHTDNSDIDDFLASL